MIKISMVFLLLCFTSHSRPAMASEKAVKLWKYLNGTNLPASDSIIMQIEAQLAANKPDEAAKIAINSPKSIFLVNTIRNTFGPLAFREYNPSAPLGDFVLTWMMGAAKDISIPNLFLTDVRYALVGQQDPTEGASTAAIDTFLATIFSDAALLRSTQVSDLKQTYIMDESALGVVTSKQYGRVIFEGGTNRRAVKKIAEDFLCAASLESIMAFNYRDNWVGKDIDRMPGGELNTYLRKCVGCHAGMDAVRGAFAGYDYNTSTGQLNSFRGVVPKMNTNPLNFTPGYFVRDTRWKHFGWLPMRKDLAGNTYDGARSLMQMLVTSEEFYRCLAVRAKNTMCSSKPFPEDVMSNITAEALDSQNLKRLFGSVATDVCLQ